nr:MAG: hypothetical protein 2 [Dicistroviridae sp.]
MNSSKNEDDTSVGSVDQGTLLTGEEVIVHQRQTVTFLEDGDVNLPEVNTSSTVSRRYLVDAGDELENSVKDFLSRPIKIANFDWLASSGSLITNGNYLLPLNWITTKMIEEKLAGFRFLRCDFVVRVQVNAQPFNAGRLLLVYIPLYGQLNANNVGPGAKVNNTTTLAGLTGYRHVDLDLATSTSCELRIPWHGPLTHMDLVQLNGAFGAVKVVVYSPLTGSTDVDGTVWCWAENIDVTLPTGMTVFPESGYAQSGKLAAEKKPGDIEALATKVGNVSRGLRGLPVIGELAGTATWIADAVKGAASIFGFSKPTNPEFPTQMETRFAKYLNTYNGVAAEKSLALDARNAVDIPKEVYGTDEDEMAISTIVSRKIFMDSFKFDTTMEQDALLWKWPANPDACQKVPYSFGGRQNLLAENTYLSYLSTYFRYWRGDLCYRVKVVKTPFHSGRIRVTVVPGANMNTAFNTIDLNKNYSTIYDLRETNEFDICVPFKWKAPFKSIPGAINGLNPSWPSPKDPPCMVYISVVNALRTNSNAADTIEFLIESYAENFEFAFPNKWAPWQPLVWASGVTQVTDRLETGFAQIGEVSHATQNDFDVNGMAMGEAVRSLRQVLRRYSKVSGTWIEPSKTTGSQIFDWATNPTINPSNIDTRVTGLDEYFNNADDYTFFSFLYRFQSGSMRIALAQARSAGLHHLTIIPDNSANNGYDVRNGPNQIMIPPFEPFAEYNVPFYQQWPAVATFLGNPWKTNCEFAEGRPLLDQPYNRGTWLKLDGDDADFDVFRSIGEDFSFGYLIGPPQTVLDLGPTPP